MEAKESKTGNKNKIKIIIAVLIVIVIGVGLLFFISNGSESKDSDDAIPPATDNVQSVSDDWRECTFELDGADYQFPCTLSVFEKNGWTIYSEELSEKSKIEGQGLREFDLKKEESTIKVLLANTSGKSMDINDCTVYGAVADLSELPGLGLSNGIKYNSTADEIKAAFGNDNESADDNTFVYRDEGKYYCNYCIETENGKCTSVTFGRLGTAEYNKIY